MADLLTYITGEAVRSALDPSGLLLDPASFDDAKVRQPLFGGRAVSYVLARDPAAAGREDPAEVAHLTAALNLFTASLIAPFVTSKTREKLEDYEVAFDKSDWAKRASELRAAADAELDYVMGAVVSGAAEGVAFLVIE